MAMSNIEKIIAFLNNEFEKSDSKNVSVHKNNISDIGLTESEIIQTLSLMEGKYFSTTKKSVHNDLSIPWYMELNEFCVCYFENKKKKEKAERNQWIQFWIPVSISICALMVSILGIVFA